jgi:hypothetical protein
VFTALDAAAFTMLQCALGMGGKVLKRLGGLVCDKNGSKLLRAESQCVCKMKASALRAHIMVLGAEQACDAGALEAILRRVSM